MAEAIRLAKWSELRDHAADGFAHMSGEDRRRLDEAFSRSGGYVHVQESSRNVWTIPHNMGKYPSVSTFTDTGGRMDRIFGDVGYPSENTVTVTFSISVSGVAYLN